MIDILIIGAGPAGLTAAIYARRALKNTIILEKNVYGGSIINTLDIENYPVNPHISGFDLATNMYNQAIDLGVKIIYEEAIEIIKKDDYFEVISNKNKYDTKTIIIATGTKYKKLGLELEDELIGKGISFCATCDGAFYKDKEVAVVGGGNTALEDSLYLSNMTKKVYLIHRRDSFRGSPTTIEKVLKKDNIEILYNSTIEELYKNNDNILEGILVNTKNSQKRINISGLFEAIGRIPENNIFEKLGEVNNGYITSKEDCHTSVEGIFAAGDNRDKKLRQIVTATSDGAIAATEAIIYLDN